MVGQRSGGPPDARVLVGRVQQLDAGARATAGDQEKAQTAGVYIRTTSYYTLK